MLPRELKNCFYSVFWFSSQESIGEGKNAGKLRVQHLELIELRSKRTSEQQSVATRQAQLAQLRLLQAEGERHIQQNERKVKLEREVRRWS